MDNLSRIHKIILPLEGPLKNVNVYLIEGEQLTLVDVGEKNKDSWDTLNNELKLLGYSISDIKNIIATHHHLDHISGLDFFTGNVHIIGHEKNEPWFTHDETVYQNSSKYINNQGNILGVPEEIIKTLIISQQKLTLSSNYSLNIKVSEGDIIPGIPEFTVIETPGHSTSHISLYRKEDGLIIGGDVLIKDVFLNTIFEPPNKNEHERPKLILSYNETLNKIKNLNPKIILPGHGEPIENVEEFINLQFKKQNKRLNRVRKLLSEKPHTIFELCTKLFAGFYKFQFVLVFSDILAMLDLLEQSDELLINKGAEPWLFSIKY